MATSTGFAELDRVLDDFVRSVRSALGDNFCGAYLQGSFALGAADEHSDADFVVVTEEAATDEEMPALQAIHRRIHALPSSWAQHLEGSYFPRALIWQVDPARRAVPYLDNGASQLVADGHCNTAVMRWVLRERGIKLAGPDPASLVAPVSATALRDEAMATLHDYATWARTPSDAGGMSQWKQPYLVVSFCRVLHTLDRGEVASKPRAGEWALGSLDAEWQPLIRRALEERTDPGGRVKRAADPAVIARTLAFVDYAIAVAGTVLRRA